MTSSLKRNGIKNHDGSQVSSSRRTSIAGPSALIALSTLPSLAQAHSGHIHSTTTQAPSFLATLQAGLLHPVTGLDHLFLAVGMGILFYGLRKQRLGMLSLTIGLLAGAALGTMTVLSSGIDFAALSEWTEAAILLSVVALAIMLVSPISRQETFSAQTRMSSIQQLSLFGFGGLAVFHGLAHAMEVPVNVGRPKWTDQFGQTNVDRPN